MKIEQIKNKLKKVVGIENVEFLSHTKNYVSADFFLMGINFISVPIFTRLLMPDEYGLLAIFSALISIAAIIMGLNLHTGIKRYYIERPDSFPQVLGTNILFLLMFAGTILIGLFLNKKFIAALLNIDEQLFLQIICVSFLTIPLQILLSYLQAIKNSKKNSSISIIKTTFTLGLAILFIMILKDQKYMGRVYADLFVSSILFVYTSYALYKISKFSSLSWEHLKYTLSFSIPLIPHTMAAFVLAYFDRIIIQQLSTPTNSGLYAFAYNVGMLMNILVMASSKSWHPIFLEEMKKQNYDKINSMAHTYSNYIYFCAIALILFSKEIVIVLADKKYYTALSIVPIIVVAYVFVFLYTLYFHYANHRKKTVLISINTMLAGVFNILLNYWLIPIYGYIIAAYNTLLSFMLLFVLHYFNARYILKETVIPLNIILPRFLIVIMVLAVNHLFLSNIDNYIVLFLIKLCILLFSAYFFVLRQYYLSNKEV